jgi:RNA-directed DNA polymerase
MVKALGGQQESEGVMVPLIGVQHNAPGGKDPCFDHAHEAGKREGMTGPARSNSPGKSRLAVADEPLVSLCSTRGIDGVRSALAAPRCRKGGTS